jgi:hypothetical protein
MPRIQSESNLLAERSVERSLQVLGWESDARMREVGFAPDSQAFAIQKPSNYAPCESPMIHFRHGLPTVYTGTSVIV